MVTVEPRLQLSRCCKTIIRLEEERRKKKRVTDKTESGQRGHEWKTETRSEYGREINAGVVGEGEETRRGPKTTVRGSDESYYPKVKLNTALH